MILVDNILKFILFSYIYSNMEEFLEHQLLKERLSQENELIAQVDFSLYPSIQIYFDCIDNETPFDDGTKAKRFLQELLSDIDGLSLMSNHSGTMSRCSTSELFEELLR